MANLGVKRIFDDATIELSESATDKAAAGGSTLTFAAFSPKVTQYVKTYRRNTTANYGVQMLMSSPDDSARLTIANFGQNEADTDRQWNLDTTSGYYPGVIAISNAYVKTATIQLRTCHLEFAQPTVKGKTPGFTGVKSIQVISGKTATVSVPDGISAEFSYLSHVYGTLVKDGAGTLTVAATNAASACTGSITVREGTLAFTEGSRVPKITVKSGATAASTSANGSSTRTNSRRCSAWRREPT